jgi:hypothetical protein
MHPPGSNKQFLLHSRCQVCGGSLQSPLDQLQGVCERLSCRGPYFREKRRREERAQKADWAARLQSVKESLPDGWIEQRLVGGELSRDELHGRVHFSLVPNCAAVITELPEERRKRFASHLDSALDAAALLIEQSSSACSAITEHEHRTAGHTSSVPLPVINGCSTCRGYCCKNGKEHAFLDAGFLAWQLLSDPTATTQSLRNSYMRQLPEHSVDGSCVFHSATGCVLRRTERSNLCNQFHCFELQDALDQDPSNPPSTWIAFSKTESDGRLRTGIMNSSGQRIEHDHSHPIDHGRADDSNAPSATT